jgi:hypothetical protein
MFSKRVKFVRDLQQETSILKRKEKREISKLLTDIEREIEKKLKKIHPACRITLEKVYPEDFKTNSKKREPFQVYIEDLNGRRMSENGTWLEWVGDEKGEKYVLEPTENYVSTSRMLEICLELSENLGISVNFIKMPEEK